MLNQELCQADLGASHGTRGVPGPVRAGGMTNGIDWTAAEAELDTQGCAVLPGLLAADVCAALRDGWEARDSFRSEVIMARHGFGRGAYRYYADPLPVPVA